MARVDTLQPDPTKAAPEAADPHADLRRRILALVYPDTPLTGEALSILLQDALDTGDPALAAELIMTAVGRGALPGAREIADRAAAHFPDSKRLAEIVALIAPPRVRMVEPTERIDRRPDFAWLDAHARDYPGEWLVLIRPGQASLDQRPYVTRIPEE